VVVRTKKDGEMEQAIKTEGGKKTVEGNKERKRGGIN
jgi:hypothetical protein